MKLSRVSRTLPVGVVVSFCTSTPKEDGWGFVVQHKRFESNRPILLEIEVPVGAESETARLLREMASELEK
jgi:hypothetical protein